MYTALFHIKEKKKKKLLSVFSLFIVIYDICLYSAWNRICLCMPHLATNCFDAKVNWRHRLLSVLETFFFFKKKKCRENKKNPLYLSWTKKSF